MTIGVIGFGRFGSFWAKTLAKFGRVLVYDAEPLPKVLGRNIKSGSLWQVAQSGIVFLCVPISQLENICKKISPMLGPTTLVADTCSVKILPAKIMKKFLPKRQPILATHPLFGPDSAKASGGVRGLKIVVCRLRKNLAQEKIAIKIFKTLGLRVVFANPREHDRQMAPSQALVHLIGRALSGLDLRPQNIATPDYDSLVNIEQMVNSDTWQLFFDMQEKNPFTRSLREKFIGNLADLDFQIALHNPSLVNLRRQIEILDKNIIRALAWRTQMTLRIGQIKQRRGLKIKDPAREKQLAAMHKKFSRKAGADLRLTSRIFNAIIKASRKVQES